MNYIWSAMILISIICAAVNGQMGEMLTAVTSGCAAAITTVLSFAGIMCFWCGIMRIIEESGAIKFLQRLLNPIIKLLFGNITDTARQQISMNIAANMLGMGNAATPAGIKAMRELDKVNKNPGKPSYEMCMLMVLNTTSVQLIPATVMSLRAAAGGAGDSVIIPIWITSVISVIAAVTAVKLLIRRS